MDARHWISGGGEICCRKQLTRRRRWRRRRRGKSLGIEVGFSTRADQEDTVSHNSPLQPTTACRHTHRGNSWPGRSKRRRISHHCCRRSAQCAHTHRGFLQTTTYLYVYMSRCTVIRTFLAIFPTTPKSYATIFFGVQRTLYWSN